VGIEDSNAHTFTVANDSPAARTYRLLVSGWPSPSDDTGLHFLKYQWKHTISPIGLPVIASVNSAGAELGKEWDAFSFAADITGFVSGYAWDFGGGAVPNTSTNPSPSVSLGAQGTYAGTLTVSNSVGTSSAFPFTYTVGKGRPRITAVNPGPTVNGYRAPAQFTLTATGAPTTWNWDFGDDATPVTSGEATPSVSFGRTGYHTVVASCGNDVGSSTVFTSRVSIAPAIGAPHVDGVHFTGSCSSEPANFSADVPAGVTGYEWDFGAAAIPSTSTEPSPTVVMSNGGSFTGTLHVSNSAGYSAPYHFNVTIDSGTPVCWTHAPIAEGLGSATTAVADVNGRLAVVYYHDAALQYAQATSATPTGPGDWATHQIDGMLEYNGETLGIVPSGTGLVVSYRDSWKKMLKVAVSTVAVPTGTNDWTIETPDMSTGNAEFSSLVELDGRPAVVYTLPDSGMASHIGLARATVALPASNTDWTLSPVNATGDGGAWISATVADGRIALGFMRAGAGKDEMFGRAQVAEPNGLADWTTHQVDSAGMTGVYSKLTVHQGRFTVAYADWSSSDVNIARATVAEPAAMSDWTRFKLADYSGAPDELSLTTVNGRLLVGWDSGEYYGSEELHLAWSEVAEPTTATNFTFQTVVSGGAFSRFVERDGRAVGVSFNGSDLQSFDSGIAY
ncbi:MAG: PKD domain-containing protein, partial [bacterium]